VVRTLALAPGFGDTRQRELRSARHTASAQLDISGTGLPGADMLVVGIEAATGTLDSKYFGVVGGDRVAYESSSGARGQLDASGDGRRTTAAAFAHWAVPLSDAVRLSLAGRLDHLRDAFEPGEPQPGERLTARHTAFSPRAGLNARYLRRPGASGHAFVTWGRSFKAPTPDQLFDQRPIPVPFPPFSVMISNALLEPQRAVSLEGGVYQELMLGDARAAATVGLYQMDLSNELDFDVQALRYVNIGRSRHRGLEVGMTLSAPPGISAFANYALQSAEARAGPTAGKQLKALPRHVVALGASFTAASGLEAGATLIRLHRMYLDDENTRTIPAWSRADLRLGWRLGTARLALDVYNALDARYATTGFLDPAGTGEAYWHPAAGRHVRLGVSRDW
jgi:outer membrane receptor protein involved in Fe transport